jgi:hypothetical protein
LSTLLDDEGVHHNNDEPTPLFNDEEAPPFVIDRDEDEETDSSVGACLSPSARRFNSLHPLSAPCSPACC